MTKMVNKLGDERGRKLYNMCSWGIKMFRPNYLKKEIEGPEDSLETGSLMTVKFWKHEYPDRVNEFKEPGWLLRPHSVDILLVPAPSECD